MLSLLGGCSSVAPATEEYRAISIQPMLEGANKTRECVAKKGFTVDVTPTGEISYTDKQVPDGQAALADAAIAECAKKYAVGLVGPWPRDQLPRLYALELAALDCERDLGLVVDDPPSLQRFIDTYGTSQAWGARSSATMRNQLDQDSYTRLVLTCPDPEQLGTP